MFCNNIRLTTVLCEKCCEHNLFPWIELTFWSILVSTSIRHLNKWVDFLYCNKWAASHKRQLQWHDLREKKNRFGQNEIVTHTLIITLSWYYITNIDCLIPDIVFRRFSSSLSQITLISYQKFVSINNNFFCYFEHVM